MTKQTVNAPFRGVRTPREPRTQRERIEAYAPLLRQGQAFSHVSAAVLWGMWLPAGCDFATLVDVTSVGAGRPVRMRGVRGHHADAGSVELMRLGELLVTSPLDTFRTLSTRLSLHQLVAAGDSLVRRQGPLLTMPELERVIGRHAGNRGNRLLRAVVPLVRPGCDSARETEVRLILVEGGLPEPVVNAIVSRPGERLRLGDLVYPEWKVIVEYDGRHHLTDEQVAADILRLEQLARGGWTVVRVVYAHLKDPRSILRRVREPLAAAGWRR